MIIPIQNQLSYRSIPRNKDLGLTITNSCDFASRVLVVDTDGECFICACEAWLPISVGNILDFEKLQDIWLTPAAIELQQDIEQKKFTHCAVDRCGILHSDQKSIKFTGRTDVSDCYYISINIDDSCNLQCPSCRPNLKMETSGEGFDRKSKMVNHLVQLLEKFDQPAHVIMTGNGDPLASSIMRPLLHNYRPPKTQTLRLFTNGLLLEKQLADNPIVNNISQYFISIDAGSQEVYERVRLGGKHKQLLANLHFLRKLVHLTGASVLLKFVLQRDNWTDMEEFVLLCKRYRFNGVINRLEDWGTWPNFSEHDVIGNTNHADHAPALAELKRVYTLYHNRIQFNPSLEDLANEHH